MSVAAGRTLEPRIMLSAPNVDLGTLDGTNGFRLDGIDSNDGSGRSVSDAGDVNGDGFDDLIIGAPSADPGGASNAGESYVVFGKAGGFDASLDLSTLDGTNGFRLDGIDAGDRSGLSVSGAGDVNGDGFDDLIVGAYGANRDGFDFTGENYVVFGQAGPFAASLDLSTLDGTNGFRIDGVAASQAGRAVSDAGDVNGDGFGDLIIGARGGSRNGFRTGETYVVFGHAGGFAAALDASTLDGTNGFRLDGIDFSDSSGFAVSGAGDVNGDGFDDLIVGAYQADPNGKSSAGESYVVFGQSDGFAASLNFGTLDGSNGFRLDGVDPFDDAGVSVSGAGDINGDGFDDLIVGAESADPGGASFGGESYVVFGQAGGFAAAFDLNTLDGTNGFRLDGIDAGDRSGKAVSGAGDVNGDGFDDILIGANRADFDGAESVGETYLIFGKAGGFAAALALDALDGTNGFRLDGIDARDQSGLAASGAGDVNGDGFDDLIIGAYGADRGDDFSTGESYVVFGGNFTGGVETQVGDETANTLTATQGAGAVDVLIGGRGNDLLTSDGGADVLIGGEGDDTLTIIDTDFSGTRRIQGGTGATGGGQAGFDTLALSGSGLTLDLTAISDNRITGIESIDLTGSGGNTLRLDQREVLNLSDDTNTLIVQGTTGDVVSIEPGWTRQPDETLLSRTFAVFAQGAATLKVDADIVIDVVIPLDSLDGTNGFRLDGIDSNDRSGRSVSDAGDVNGDGFDDIIVGAYGADPGDNSRAGESYVVFGRAGGFADAVDLSTLDGTNGFRIDGVDVDDRSGASVSGAGDVNADGFDDLIIGALTASPDGNSEAGESYIVFGKAGGFADALDLSTLDGTNGFRLDGIDAGDQSGLSVSGAGDVNGDGFDDLIIGADDAAPNGEFSAGESYVVFGQASGFAASIDLSSLDGTNGFRLDGIDADDQSGGSVSGAGDVNGDGFDDLIVAARFGDPGGNESAGETYVVFGQAVGFPAAFDLSTLDGANGFRLDGVDAGDLSGSSVSGAGDVNGDGFDDLIVGARFGAPGGNESAGESYVVFGRAAGFAAAFDLNTLDGINGFRVDGVDAGDFSGISVSGAGDVNSDGFDDLIIGAFGAEGLTGETHIVFGNAGGFTAALDLNTLDGTNGFRLDGIDSDDQSGLSVSGAGDVNGDGFDDLIVGARLADPNGVTNAGESYVIFGGNFTGGTETQVGTAGDDTLLANQGASAVDILIGGRGNDSLRSDGGADVLVGGEGDDQFTIVDTDFSGTRRIDGGTGASGGPASGLDTLALSGNGLTLDLTAIADNRITGIESIDLTGDGNNELILNQLEVLNLSGDTNTLIVHGAAGDAVQIEPGWKRQADESLLGRTLAVYTRGEATLKVDAAVTVNAAIRVATLDGTNGFRLDGVIRFGFSGDAVSGAGDINGDGFDDFIIGAPRADSYSGESYVVFGKAGGFDAAIDLDTLDGTNGFRIDGADNGDFSGIGVSGGVDVNGDGFDDLIVGANNADPGDNNFAGETYVVFGRADGFAAALDLGTLDGTNGFRINGVDDGDRSGRAVSGAGDINGDGLDDLIIGAYFADSAAASNTGVSYVVFGQEGGFSAALDLAALDGTNGFSIAGVDSNDLMGVSVSGAGDFNGDGFDDLIVGASSAELTAGESYVVFGRAGGFAAALDAGTLDGTNGFRLVGVEGDDRSGRSVSGAGDVNGDGFDDIIIGASGADRNDDASVGESYVVFGGAGGFSASLDLGTLDGTNGFRLNGVDSGDSSGIAVSDAGDVNGDGFDDLIIGASGAAQTGKFSVGESYVVFGQDGGFAASLDLSTLDGTRGFRIDGIDSRDRSGDAVSGAGDVNGDGFDDIIIGAYGADPNGNSYAGESYVIFGGNFTGGTETQVGTTGADNLVANQGAAVADMLIGGRGNDLLTSDGGADVLRGGEGNDTLRLIDADFSGTRRFDGGNGNDTLTIASAGVTLDLTAIADNRITNIERIEMRTAGTSTLTLDVQEVLNISTTSNTLFITKNEGDVVNIGEGWVSQGVFNGAVAFEELTQGAATLFIQLGNAPVINGLPGPRTVKLDELPLVVAPTGSIVDANSANFAGGRFRVLIPGANRESNDHLQFVNTNRVTISNAVGAAVVVDGLTIGTVIAKVGLGTRYDIRMNTNATSSRVSALIRAIQFDGNQSGGQRTVSFEIQDGDGEVATASLNITAASEKPVIAGLPEAVAATSDFFPITVGPEATITDADSANFNTGRFRVFVLGTNRQSNDHMQIGNVGGVTTSAGNEVGSKILVDGIEVGTLIEKVGIGTRIDIRMNANATPARISQLIQAVQFDGDQAFADKRTVAYFIEDGGGERVVKTVDVTVTSQPPTIAGLPASVTGTTAQAPLFIGGSATISDPDSPVFDGGLFRVFLLPTNRLSNDHLQIGNTARVLAVAGNVPATEVKVDGITIGTVSEKIGLGTRLDITLNGDATLDRIGALIQATQFDGNQAGGIRSANYFIEDGQGGRVQADVNVSLT